MHKMSSPDDALIEGPDNRTLKRVGIGAAALALLVVIAGGAWRYSALSEQRQTSAEAAIPTVAVVTPITGSGTNSLVLPGTIQAYNSAAIYARTNGYVRRWLADIGDHVRAGQVLVTLDAPEIDQQLAQARADYQTAVAERNLADTTSKRWATMLTKDAVSRQEADEKAGDLAAKSALANAALAKVKQLQAQQGFTRLTAPFDGVVTSRSAQIGALVVAGNSTAQPLFTISDTHRMRIYVRVPQSTSSSIRQGMTASLSLPEYPGREIPATLTRSAGAVDPQSGAVLVELEAANPNGVLKPGAFSQVHFALAGTKTNAVRIPGSAILYGNDGPSVVIARGDRVVVKPITIARDEGDMVLVSIGVAPSDQIVDSPPDAIRSGDQVHVLKSPPAAKSAANAH
jgi:RND family efflux transporter MFP subunit